MLITLVLYVGFCCCCCVFVDFILSYMWIPQVSISLESIPLLGHCKTNYGEKFWFLPGEGLSLIRSIIGVRCCMVRKQHLPQCFFLEIIVMADMPLLSVVLMQFKHGLAWVLQRSANRYICIGISTKQLEECK